MRRTENEDALRFAKIQAAVCPSRAVARVIVASVPGEAGRQAVRSYGSLNSNGSFGGYWYSRGNHDAGIGNRNWRAIDVLGDLGEVSVELALEVVQRTWIPRARLASGTRGHDA